MTSTSTLLGYIQAVAARIDSALEGTELHPGQRALVAGILHGPREQSLTDPLGDPLSLLYLISRAHARRMDDQAARVGAFCLLYVLASDVIDDVQDDDLGAPRYAETTPAIAINNGITLLFLALDLLRQAIELEPMDARRFAYLRLFNRVSLEAVAGQHRDLLGAEGALAPDDVLSMQQAKTSSVALVAECGALLAGCDAESQSRFRRLGETMTLFVQVRDDLRDIFGKSVSPDLLAGKVTHPIACFLAEASADERAEYQTLLEGLPETMPELQGLLYRSGAVEATAGLLDDLRETLHHTVASVPQPTAYLRVLLDVVDTLAEAIYELPPIAATAHLWHPRGNWHEAVRSELERCQMLLKPYGLSEVPALRPWMLPHWMYVPEKQVIFYPDLEELAEEIVPFYAELLGSDDFDEVEHLFRSQLAALLAHEVFHYWRDATQRLSSDHWHEEWVANRLAVSYCVVHAPSALASALDFAERAVARHPQRLDANAHRILARCASYDPSTKGYELDMVGMAVVTAEMVRRLAREQPAWRETCRELLSTAEVESMAG